MQLPLYNWGYVFCESTIMTLLEDALDFGAKESHEAVHVNRKCTNNAK